MSLTDTAGVNYADLSDHHCKMCNRPDDADPKMVQCNFCNGWYHFGCVSVNDSIANDDRVFVCPACTGSNPGSVASTSASTRDSRIQLEMQRLAEEKQLQVRMQEERAKQDREMQEMALRLESERRDKTMVAMLALEKEFIKKKYDLLHTQLDEGDDAVSTRSRRNYIEGANKVQEWISRNPTVTLSANPGYTPTGLTSQIVTLTSSTPIIPSITTTAVTQSSFVPQAIASKSSAGENTMAASSNFSLHPMAVTTSTSASQQLAIPQQLLSAGPASASVMQWNQDRTIPTSLIGAQQGVHLPSTNDNNMFVISPATTASVSYPLLSLPATAPLSSYTQRSAMQSVGYGSVQPHLSTSCTVFSGETAQPLTTAFAGQQPLCLGQQPVYNLSSLHTASDGCVRACSSAQTTQSAISYQNMQNVNATPVSSSLGQYVLPKTVVSTVNNNSRGYSYDMLNTTIYNAQNSCLAVSNYMPLSSLSQQVHFSNPIVQSHSSGNWENNRSLGYQGYEINPLATSFSQPIFTGTSMALHYPRVSSIPQSNVTNHPSAAEAFRGPNAQQLAARHVVPKDLPSFGGSFSDWPLFCSSFETSTQIVRIHGS